MIYVTGTPNCAGVTIHGDHKDLDELYNALHEVVGDEEEYPAYHAARIRVLGVCFDLRHANMGDRMVEFVDNGVHPELMKQQSVIAPVQNVYMSFNTLWPEILFVTLILNDFIRLHANKSKYPDWNKEIALVRLFQSAVSECIKQTVAETLSKRIIKTLNDQYLWLENYATQYVDVLNCKFLEMEKEKRLKNLSIMAKRLVERNAEYLEVKNTVMNTARKYGCSVTNIRIGVEYPEEIKW